MFRIPRSRPTTPTPGKMRFSLAWLPLAGFGCAAAADCTEASKALKTMQLKSWRVWHAVTVKAHLRADFGVVNQATGDNYAIKGIPYIDDNEWHVCEAGGGSLPKQLVGCAYIYDTMNGEFGFQFQWSCAGSGGAKAYVASPPLEYRDW